jgi:hypothetical protein
MYNNYRAINRDLAKKTNRIGYAWSTNSYYIYSVDLGVIESSGSGINQCTVRFYTTNTEYGGTVEYRYHISMSTYHYIKLISLQFCCLVKRLSTRHSIPPSHARKLIKNLKGDKKWLRIEIIKSCLFMRSPVLSPPQSTDRVPRT